MYVYILPSLDYITLCVCVCVCVFVCVCSASDGGGGDFKEAQGPNTLRATEANYRAPTLELTNKFSGLEDD